MTKIIGSASSADDRWGCDPSIQRMRRVFARMEKTQTQLLEALRISPLDQRLRRWRREALHLFEQRWHQSTKRGNSLGESQIADLYYACFTDILAQAGFPVPAPLIPADQEDE